MNSTQTLVLFFILVIALLTVVIYQNWNSLFKVLMIVLFETLSICAAYLICATIGDWVTIIALLLIGVMIAGYTASGELNRFNFKCLNICKVVVLVGLLLTSIFR